jgi:hypothetical protein
MEGEEEEEEEEEVVVVVGLDTKAWARQKDMSPVCTVSSNEED